MSAYVETSNASKYDKEESTGPGTMQTPAPNRVEEIREKNTGNRKGNQSCRIMELVQLHTAHRYLRLIHRK